MRLVAILGLLLGACVDVDYGGTSFLCNGVEPCPDGLSCVAGRCQAGGDVVDAGDPGSSDGGFDAGPCFAPINLVDNFDDNSPDTSLWAPYAQGGATAVETGGELVVTPQPAFATRRFAGFPTTTNFNLTDARVFVEVPQVTDTATSTQTRLRVGDGAGAGDTSYLYIIQQDGVLRMGVRLSGGGENDSVSIPYDAAAHRWWQIRESSGQSIGETSPDGISWTVRSTGVSPGFVDSLKVDLSAGTTESVANPGEAHFDNLNGGGALDMCP